MVGKPSLLFNKWGGGRNNPIVIYEKHKQQLKNDQFASYIINDFNHNRKYFVLPLSKIKSLIASKNIKVVSFDIFDTLLTRNTSQPQDVFKILAKYLASKGIHNFYKTRVEAEDKLGNPVATLQEIYEYIYICRPDLSRLMIDFIMNKEQEIESALLNQRKDGKELYDYAISLGKRIICASDMYLPKSFISRQLEVNGYTQIQRLYISSEIGLRKDSGRLYEYIIGAEQIAKSELLHIGDNFYADYYNCLESGMPAVWLANHQDKMYGLGNTRQLYEDGQKDIFSRFIECYTKEYLDSGYLEKFFNYNCNPQSCFYDFRQFVELVFAPFVLGIAINILRNAHIQKHYKKILFSSRDGYLPKIVYDLLRTEFGGRPSEYVYAGRMAYACALCDNVIDYIRDFPAKKTVPEVLQTFVKDKELLARISMVDGISELKTGEIRDAHLLFKPFMARLDEEFQKLKQHAYDYYNGVASDNDREIIYDCGFSGSVSRSLSEIMGKPVDKIYLYETEKNRECDLKYGTVTYCLLKEKDIPPRGISLAYEELCSPVEGTCISFDKNGKILEDEYFQDVMREKYGLIKEVITNYTEKFIENFRSSFAFFDLPNLAELQSPLVAAIFAKDPSTLDFFDDIRFLDRTVEIPDMTLSEKLSYFLPYKSVFAGTSYLRSYYHKPVFDKFGKLKLGIHMHCFYPFVLQQFIRYFAVFPLEFDLFVTCPNQEIADICMTLFNRGCMQNLGNLQVTVFPNRGRDVAPWLIGMAPCQKDYDLFCHVQSKVSPSINWGGLWRSEYLDELLGPEHFANILQAFADNPNLGCVVPRPFHALVDLIHANCVELSGMFGEFDMINHFLKRIGIHRCIVRKDLCYSMGTMYWYRPQALKQLFDADLSPLDFPPEPIGIGGTLAHALERLPTFIAKYNGYDCMIYPPVADPARYYHACPQPDIECGEADFAPDTTVGQDSAQDDEETVDRNGSKAI